MKIDTTGWKLFDFPKLFDIKKGFYNKKPEESGLGTIPFLGATEDNNGVTAYYTYEEIDSSSRTGEGRNETIERKLFPGNAVCVTNNGSVGYAYYQKDSFTCSHDVNPLYLRGKQFNEYTGMFIAAVIMYDRYRWGYGRKWRPERMKNSQLKLPILRDKDDNPVIDSKKLYSEEGFIPDWQWMENYIKSLHHKPVSTKVVPDIKNEISTNNWQYFKLEDIFVIKKGKRLTAEDQTDGETPYIGAIDNNNGVSNYIGQDAIHEGNTISLSYNGSVGEAFYQPKPFWATDDVNVLYFKKTNGITFNKYIALFICTVLRCEQYRFCYGRKWTLESMKATNIKLPVSSNGKPDWGYMEQYMKSLPFSDRI